MKTTKPVLSPRGESFGAAATIGTSTVPPGGTVTIAASGVTDAPELADCASIETVQAPAPPPASLSETNSGLRAPALAVFRKPNESELGLAKSFGLFAVATLTRPAPSSSTEASCVRAVLPQAGPAVVIRADLTCCGVQAGCCWSSSAAEPETCGADMLVPSKTAKFEPANSVSVEERICPPGAARSGLSAWVKLVGPADEKLVTIPLRPVWISSGLFWPVARKVVRPACASMNARRLAPSRSEIIPPGMASNSGMKFASPKRLSTKMTPVPPACWIRSTFESKVQPPRETSATRPPSEPGGSVDFVPSFGSKPAGAHSCRSTGCPSVPVIVPTSCSSWSNCCQPGGTWRLYENGMCWAFAGAPAAVSVISGPKTCRFETAATEIASGALLGEPTEPRPKSSRSFPAEITGTTPAAATLSAASISASLAGSTSGPPPEKLSTFMPSLTTVS